MATITRYQKRISGPLLDRIDIHIEVPRVEYDKLTSERTGEPSANIRDRVETARARQRDRFEGSALGANADMGPAEVRKFCALDDAGRSLVRSAMQQLQMSARAFHRILKLARTIADLEGAGDIQTQHQIILLPSGALTQDKHYELPFSFIIAIKVYVPACARHADRPADTEEQAVYQHLADIQANVEIVAPDAGGVDGRV